MIKVEVKPRADNKFDIYVYAGNGEQILNSSQGYENPEDAVEVVRRLFGPGPTAAMKVTLRDGKTHTEQLR